MSTKTNNLQANQIANKTVLVSTNAVKSEMEKILTDISDPNGQLASALSTNRELKFKDTKSLVGFVERQTPNPMLTRATGHMKEA